MGYVNFVPQSWAVVRSGDRNSQTRLGRAGPGWVVVVAPRHERARKALLVAQPRAHRLLHLCAQLGESPKQVTQAPQDVHVLRVRASAGQ